MRILKCGQDCISLVTQSHQSHVTGSLILVYYRTWIYSTLMKTYVPNFF